MEFGRISDLSRPAVMRALIATAITARDRLAGSALDTLIHFSNDRHIDIRLFLSLSSQEKLVDRYRSLILTRAHGQQQHDEFEMQLGLKQR
jgi:hypothetical protein